MNPNNYYSNFCNKPSCVYRIYDIEGALLYVGMTTNPAGRIPTHRRKPWGQAIAYWTVEWFPNRWETLAAEKAAIAAENPIHNITRPKVGAA